MAERKTAKNHGSVKQFLDSIDDATKCKDSREVVKIMREATGARATSNR